MERTERLLQQTAPAFPSSSLQRYCRVAVWLLFVLMIAIGSIPGKAEALSAATHDKLLHFCAYFILSLLLYAGLSGAPLRRTLGTLFIIAMLGLADETIQYFLPYRNSETMDWMFNMMAASLSVTLCSTFQHLIKERRTHFQIRQASQAKNE
jgi:VanZ family protein